MEIIFRAMQAGAPEPGPGELHLRPAEPKDAGRRDLATLLLARGVAALTAGPGAPTRLVVPANPTLDDLLAAEFARRLVRGEPLPAGSAALARYAALVREGLQPGDLPAERSLEAIFLAMRNAHGADLTQSTVAARFLADWERVASLLLAAAGKGVDPFTTPLFDGAEFARERAFLAKDRDVYRQDVLRGERWLVTIPGAPANASGLLLREPKSLLAKQWSRRDADAPAGDTYLFLAVDWGAGQWVFSTDPVQRLSLKQLAERMAAESKEPWFDGAPFAHTLIAAPHGGTKLPADRVEKLLKEWLRARKPKKAVRRALPLTSAAIVLAAAALLLQLNSGGARGPAAREPVDFRLRGLDVPEHERREMELAASSLPRFALILGVGKSSMGHLPAACRDAADLYRLLRDRYGYDPAHMRLLLDDSTVAIEPDGASLTVAGLPDHDTVLRCLEELGALTLALPEQVLSQFLLYYAGHGDRRAASKAIGYLVLSGFAENRARPPESRRPDDSVGLDMGQLSDNVQKFVRSEHKLLLIDCCFSGFAALTRGDPFENLSSIYLGWRRPAHIVLTAGTEGEPVREDRRSFFARAVFDALGWGEGPLLADVNQDGIVTDAEFGRFVQIHVEERAAQGGHVQRPYYVRGLPGDGLGQFLFKPN
ncbi:MAG: hypothetical protein ACT4PV_05125 [Planctomycetaceae bacterium]